jgi:hypothetical protein
VDLVGSIFNGVAASFGTSCIAGRNRITYGHEDGDVYQFENDRVVEPFSPFFFSYATEDWFLFLLLFPFFLYDGASKDEILGVYSSSSDNTSEHRIR